MSWSTIWVLWPFRRDIPTSLENPPKRQTFQQRRKKIGDPWTIGMFVHPYYPCDSRYVYLFMYHETLGAPLQLRVQVGKLGRKIVTGDFFSQLEGL